MRKDGRKIKTIDPMYKIIGQIMVDRNDAMNMIELTVQQDPIRKYMRRKKDEGYTFSHLAIVIAAYIRTVAEYPFLNRFVVNRTLYARNEVAVGMVVLKPGETEGTMNKMYFKPDMTIYQIQEVLDEYINTNRGTGETNSTDKIINTLLSIPGLARVGVSILKWMDWHGLLPKAIINASPFHCSMTITNLASIGTNYIFHHVYNFGTTSMVMAMGNTREDAVRRHGEIVFEKVIPIGLVMDERIAEGVQFAMACRKLQSILQDPSILEQPPAEVKEDIK
ncbi:MAG: 2-oxo acid dehydrogenase subunit E2 [Treponema sp.]|nr:2-oxo acid dehydrogenase subunit E2 [Treponema sp.]